MLFSLCFFRESWIRQKPLAKTQKPREIVSKKTSNNVVCHKRSVICSIALRLLRHWFCLYSFGQVPKTAMKTFYLVLKSSTWVVRHSEQETCIINVQQFHYWKYATWIQIWRVWKYYSSVILQSDMCPASTKRNSNLPESFRLKTTSSIQ